MPLTGSMSDACPGKGPSLCEREIRPHCSLPRRTKMGLFSRGPWWRTRADKVLQPDTLPSLLLVTPQKQTIQKTPTLDLSTTEKRLVYSNTLSGTRGHFHWFQEEFPHPENGCWTPEIKLKYKRYLLSLSFTFSWQPSQTKKLTN